MRESSLCTCEMRSHPHCKWSKTMTNVRERALVLLAGALVGFGLIAGALSPLVVMAARISALA
jgi:hypothetical protein